MGSVWLDNLAKDPNSVRQALRGIVWGNEMLRLVSIRYSHSYSGVTRRKADWRERSPPASSRVLHGQVQSNQRSSLGGPLFPDSMHS